LHPGEIEGNQQDHDGGEIGAMDNLPELVDWTQEELQPKIIVDDVWTAPTPVHRQVGF
jgi:hypothetical protein